MVRPFGATLLSEGRDLVLKNGELRLIAVDSAGRQALSELVANAAVAGCPDYECLCPFALILPLL